MSLLPLNNNTKINLWVTPFPTFDMSLLTLYHPSFYMIYILYVIFPKPYNLSFIVVKRTKRSVTAGWRIKYLDAGLDPNTRRLEGRRFNQPYQKS